MLDVSTFFKNDASDQWFSMEVSGQSAHEYLEAHHFNVIDRKALTSKYSQVRAPVGLMNLSYTLSMPTPTNEFRWVFIADYNWALRTKEINGKSAPDILTAWMRMMTGPTKYVMSLVPKTYLFATTDSVSFEDIFAISRRWSIDCCIGVFDDSMKTMFVFNEEFGTVYVGFDPDHVPLNVDDVSAQFDQVLEGGFVDECRGRTGGDRDRLEEFYQSVVAPYV